MSKLIFTILLLMPLTALSQTATYFCDYDKYSDVGGIHKVEGGFSLTFLVNRETNEGYLVGNNGSAKVALIVADGQVSFIEITKSGNIMSTTIDSELNSVHSRNFVSSGRMLPSQYYGKCKAK